MTGPAVEIESQLSPFDSPVGGPRHRVACAVSARLGGELLWRWEVGWVTLTHSGQTSVDALRSAYALLSRWAGGLSARDAPSHPWTDAESDLFDSAQVDPWASRIFSGRTQQDLEDVFGQCLTRLLFPTDECIRAVAEIIDGGPLPTRLIVSSADAAVQALPFELASMAGNLLIERPSVSLVRRASSFERPTPVRARVRGLPMVRSSTVACHSGPLDQVARDDAETAREHPDCALQDGPSIEELAASLRTKPSDLTVLSCHGVVGVSPTERYAVLQFDRERSGHSLESVEGMAPTEILDAMRAAPRLPVAVVVNACLSAVGGPWAPSLTQSIAGLGVGYVVGWQDLVLDPLASQLFATVLAAFHDGDDLEWAVAKWRCTSERQHRWALVTWMREGLDWEMPSVVPRPRLPLRGQGFRSAPPPPPDGTGFGEGVGSCGQLLHWLVGDDIWQASIPLNRSVRLSVAIDTALPPEPTVTFETAGPQLAQPLRAMFTTVWIQLAESLPPTHPKALRVRVVHDLPEIVDGTAAYLSAFVLALHDLYGTFPDSKGAASALSQAAPRIPWQGAAGAVPRLAVQSNHDGYPLLADIPPLGAAAVVRFFHEQIPPPEPTRHRNVQRARGLLRDLIADISRRGAIAVLDSSDEYAREFAPNHLTRGLPDDVKLALTREGRLAALSLAGQGSAAIGIDRADPKRYETAWDGAAQ